GMVAGLLTAVAAYFWATRLLPVEFAQREAWEVHSMFLTWFMLLILSVARPPARSWPEQFALAAVAFALLPVLTLFTSDRHLGRSLPAGDWPLAGFDLTVLGLGLVCAWVSYRLVVRQRSKLKHRRNVTTPTPGRASGAESSS
ncbi:MAG: hypothetical protein LAT50_18915, partial [Ectothiorhodospiraceae bacterium]|nr:hypothetical protein [Ectothiorhodospiraceae bacterium]